MNKNDLRLLIKSDLYRYYGDSHDKISARGKRNNSGFAYMRNLRKCQYYADKNIILYKFYRYLLVKKNI